MTLDDFLSGKIGIEPSVFDRHFALPDTPFVVFQFENESILALIATSFQLEHPGKKIALNGLERKLFAPRSQDSNTPHLLLDVIRELADDGVIPKDGIEVTGLNELPT